MELKKTYQVGHFYEEYQNLDRVGLYDRATKTSVPVGNKEIAIYRYTDRFYNSTLRFSREEGISGFRWRLTEIWDAYQHKGVFELPTVSKPNPNKSLGDRVMDAFERMAKL